MGKMKRTEDQVQEDIKKQSKVCCICEVRKSFSDFYNYKNKNDGKSYRCKLCDDSARKKWAEKNPESAKLSARRRNWKHKYGLTEAQYFKMLDNQGGQCLICCVDHNKPYENFAVDHDHATGKVRGLLCNRCNRCLGLLGDSVDLLENALRYLKAETH